jgi:surfeit locus 1 family protein
VSATRFPWVLTLCVAVSLAILITLGSWQATRRGEKQAELDREAEMLSAAPVWLPNILTGAIKPEDLHRTPVEADCPGLAQAPYVELHGLDQEGRMVRRLISACPLSEGPYDAILVDRGYVRDFISARPSVIADDHPVRVSGQLFAESSFRRGMLGEMIVAAPSRPEGAPPLHMNRDLEAMAADLDVEKPAPWFLMATTSSNPDWQALIPEAPKAAVQVSPQKHLEYALTWFGLAVVLVCIYAAMLFRRAKAR